MAHALDASFGQWERNQRVEVQVMDSIRQVGPRTSFVGRSGKLFQCTSVAPNTLRSLRPALVGGEAIANSCSLIEKVLSRGCVNVVRMSGCAAAAAARRFAAATHVRRSGTLNAARPPSSSPPVRSPRLVAAQSKASSPLSRSQGPLASVPGLRVCSHVVLEFLPGKGGSRSLRSLGWHDPSLDNITMLDNGDVQYWRHYSAGGSAPVVAIALGIGSRWAEKTSVGKEYRAGKAIADAHDWRQVEVKPEEASRQAGSASWRGSVIELSVDPQNVAELAREADAARTSLHRHGQSFAQDQRWSGPGGTCASSEWAPQGSAIRAAGLLLRSVPSRLNSLSIVCDEMEKGWWTTEVCPGDRVTQFHKQAERPDADASEADAEAPRTSLGEFVLGSDMLVIPEQGGSAASGQGTTTSGLSTEYPYLVQQFVNGTACNDETPWLGRTTELRVRCIPGMHLKVLAVTEPRTCHYEVTVGSALACGHPLLQVDSLVRPPLEQVDAAGPTVAVQ